LFLSSVGLLLLAVFVSLPFIAEMSLLSSGIKPDLNIPAAKQRGKFRRLYL